MNLEKKKLVVCLSSFSTRDYTSVPDNPEKTIEVRVENFVYKMAKLIIIIIQFAVIISLMSCGKREKEIILRQLDPQYYEELERVKKELEETKKIKARDGVDGKDGRDGIDGKDGKDGEKGEKGGQGRGCQEFVSGKR
jgi:hypothetical protein